MTRFYAATVAQSITTIRIPTDAYTFKVPAKAPWYVAWVAGKAWALLHKLKALAFHFDLKDTYTTVHIDTDDVIRRLMESHRAVQDSLGYGGEVLLIGAEDFRELMGHPHLMESHQFVAEYSYSRRLMGLTVCIIPQMTGMVVVRRNQLA
jgi:hypothetical protein